MSISLPTGENNSGSNDWSDVYSNDKALKESLETAQAELSTAQSELSALKAESPVRWYTPKVIATEESRVNTSYGKLSTADEITGVVVPTNGLIVISYSALWKGTITNTASAAIFLGSNQLKIPSSTTTAATQEGTLVESGKLRPLVSSSVGLHSANEGATTDSTFVTTGMVVGLKSAEADKTRGGFILVSAAAGTYTISVQFKASASSVTVKERTLSAAVIG